MTKNSKAEQALIAELESSLKEQRQGAGYETTPYPTPLGAIPPEKHYRQLFDTAQDGILVLDAESGAIIDANPFIVHLLGYTEEEVTGKQLWEIGAFVDVNESKAAFEELQRKEILRYENLPLRTKNGQSRQVEFVCNVFRADNKKFIQCNIRDITDRKARETGVDEARKALAIVKQSADEASEFAQSLIDTVREPLISLDQNLRVVTVSRSFYELFKVEPDETVGQLIYDLGNKQWDIPKLRELLETILPDKTTFNNYEVEHDFSTIGNRVMLLNARQIERGIGKDKIILLAFEDITERKHAENMIRKINTDLEERVAKRTELLETANKELEAFSYSVSHDLRAPVRHISGYVDLVTNRFSDILPEQGKHYLRSIAEATHQMGTLIDDLLNFSRTGRMELHQEEVDMNRVVQEALVQIKFDAPPRTIEWVIPALPMVVGDYNLLRLVWVNVLSNAMKFTQTKEKARIEIGTYDEQGETVFFVRDNGVGFDMQYAKKLFGVFQRLHPAAEFEGTGVGLANVRQIIQKHKGRTWAEAETDTGATFYFALPKQTQENI